MAIIVLMAVVSVFYTPYDPDGMDSAARFEAPSPAHLLGTDNFGRDMFSRVMTGTRVSLCVAGASIALSLVTGIVLGAVLGYFGSFADKIIIRILDAISSFPSMLLALICVSVMGTGLKSMITALYIAFIPSFTRIVRAEFMREKNTEYVLNARLMGAKPLRIMFIHILPGLRGVIISAAIIGFNNAVMAESSLSYLGLGIQPPAASLGKMLAYAQSALVSAPWCIAPGGVLILIILSAGLINEGVPSRTFIEDPERIRIPENGASAKIPAGSEDGSTAKMPAGSEDGSSAKMPAGSEKHDDIILWADGLTVSFEDQEKPVVDDVSFYVKRGQILGIVGESGSGKSVSAMSLASLLRKEAVIKSRHIYFEGRDIAELDTEGLRALRSSEIGYIFQEPMQALNPLIKIGKQLEEALPDDGNGEHEAKDTAAGRTGGTASAKERRKQKILQALKDVKLDDAERVYSSYPCELSGGMCQRVLIAMAMLRSPKLLVADEPTTALDRKTALSMIGLLKEINKKTKTGIIFISHDLYMVKELCDDVLVMEDGKVIERAAVKDIFDSPKEEYTKKLIGSYLGNLDLTCKEKAFGDAAVSAEGICAGYGKGKKRLNVINDISFIVRKGETMGICGPSGSGKSTLAKLLCGFLKPFSGKLIIDGKIGMVFQNPYASLNPSMTVLKMLEEPLILSGIKDKAERRARIKGILEEVGLSMEFAGRHAAQLSGGQRQRVAIAAALISDNDIIILDEPVSALDATVAKQVLILLAHLKKERKLTYILISHDEMVIESMCDSKVLISQTKLH